jgi:predicted protein tyrosine phosphatase
MEILVANREQIERGLRMKRAWALVSVSDPDRPQPALPLDPLRTGVLRLQFDDAEPGDRALDKDQPLRLFTAADARAVWAFLSIQRTRARCLVVQCEAGWSRSPAMAAAISLALGEDASRFFRDYTPNVFIFRRMLETMPAPLQRGLNAPEKRE